MRGDTEYTRWNPLRMQWWCEVCHKYDDDQHAILVEHVIGQKDPAGVFCEWSGEWLDAAGSDGISEADLEYVKKSLGVE